MTTTQPLSYCVVCDKRPGECDHDGPRYLDPIVYERVDGGGYRVPEHERERWDYDGWTGKTMPPTITKPKPKTLQEVMAAVQLHVFLSQNIRTAIIDAYDANPMQVTLLADHLTEQAAHLENPTGLFISRLRQIELPIPDPSASKREDDII